MDNLYGIALPIPDATAKTIAKAITQHLILKFGAPLAIFSENGKNFMSRIMVQFAELFGWRRYNTSTYHSHGNSVLERSHHNLNEYITLYIHDKKHERD